MTGDAATAAAASAAAATAATGYPWAPPPQQRQRGFSSLGLSLPSPMELSELMKVEALQDHSAEQIEAIWTEVRDRWTTSSSWFTACSATDNNLCSSASK